MYKLILADDEEDVRTGLLQLIDWEGIGFQMLETAENGKEALDLVERLHPDVIVTDIQMPFMDGLQLAQWVREHYPTTKIIILTGYEEFQYAQRAIRIGIDEYLLKPFSSDELAGVLRKVKGQIDSEMAEKENVQILTEHYRRNLPVLQNLFLSSLVSRNISEGEIHEKSSNYELELNGAKYMASIIRIDSRAGENQGSKDVDSSPTRGRRISLRETDTQLQLFAVLNIASEITGKYPQDHVFMHHDEVVILSIGKHEGEEIEGRTLQLLEEIRYSVERYLKLTVTIGAGTARQQLSEITGSYKEAQQALDYRVILGNNKVIWIEDVETRQYVRLVFDESMEKELTRCLKLGTEQELLSLLDQFFHVLRDGEVSYQDFQVYLLEILTAVIKVAKDSQADFVQIFGSSSGFLGQLSRFSNSGEAKAWFTEKCIKIKSSIQAERQSSYNKLVEEAKYYIASHYSDSDLSINTVCKHLHISTGYFSSIFKKETKLTFVNYLMQVRMEAASQLLRTSDLKAFEIAERIGFADPNYFSFCFKKKFGVSPKEYRAGERRE